MAERKVVGIRKDLGRDIIALCNPTELWSPREKHDIIRDIETGTHIYHVPWADGTITLVQIAIGPNGKYLRTDRDASPHNNLGDLPDC